MEQYCGVSLSSPIMEKVVCVLLLLGTTCFTNMSCATSLLTSSVESLSGVLCPMNVTFTCTVTETQDTSLAWIVDNNTHIANYIYTGNQNFPFSVELRKPTSGVQVLIISASVVQGGSELNFQSQLIANSPALVEFVGLSLSCGGFFTKSNSIKIDYQARATPPSPVASCSLTSSDDGARFFLQWSMAFSVQHDVDMYRVTTVPHSSSLSCSSDQLVEPSGNYSCSGLAVDMHYLFTVSAINCVDQESPPLSFTLTPQAPAPPSNVEVSALYESTGVLTQIDIQWISLPECNSIITYKVELVSSAGETLNVNVLSSDSCSGDLCSLTFNTLSTNESYLIMIQTSNAFGSSSVVYNNSVVLGSVAYIFNYSLFYEDCLTTALCSSYVGMVDGCSVRYGLDPLYKDLGPPVNGSVNSNFTVVTGWRPLTVYFLQVSTLLNAITVRLQGNFTTDVGNLGDSYLFFVHAGPILFFLGVALFVSGCVLIGCIIHRKSRKGMLFWVSVIVAIVASVLFCVTLALWLAGVVSQQDGCDVTRRSVRVSLVISAAFLSLCCVVTSAVVVCGFALACRKKTDKEIPFGTNPPEPVPDSKICQVCSEEFGLRHLKRHHNCLACGHHVCGDCSKKEAYLIYKKKKDRVCNKCYELSEQDPSTVKVGDQSTSEINPKACNDCNKIFSVVFGSKKCSSCEKLVCGICVRNKKGKSVCKSCSASGRNKQ